ncbi:uncharacterized protein LOC116853037 [Odontomachus brunneus]|uniref:uncharacterized protein LOC116853037 n=1 Tax=Odontomachus brunneus TaxID=486640 RepID=UPI0013F26FCF|nr:uncharacterized protein LOC116853037 [Odontomachus brunneus]
MAQTSTSTHQKSEHVNRIMIRAPPFFPEEPELWFAQLEVQFALSGITQDGTKISLKKLPNKQTASTKSRLGQSNGSPIPTYGYITLEPKLGLRRMFPWRFIIANVSHPIIGAGFLSHYHLLPDLQRKKLLDGHTGLQAQEAIRNDDILSVKIIKEASRYYYLLTEFPELTQLGAPVKPTQHSTKHYIEITSAHRKQAARED